MKRGLLISTLLVLFGAFSAFAQDMTISGTVLSASDNQPLPGVSVVEKGTTNGTQTDFDGKYTLKVSGNATTLVISYFGKTQEVAINGRSVVDVTFEDAVTTTEVVVTGYQTVTKEKSNIAASVVNAEETIRNRPNVSVAQTLSGQVAGLNITTSNGQPGGNSTINLRGVGSLNGETEPLFIIDGARVDEDNFRSLNPNEIATVNVLKDAGATAIYGNRGANGVVIITTKSGNYGSGLSFNYTGQVRLTYLQDQDYDLMNSQEQLTLERERGVGRGAGLSDAEIAAATTTDWADFFFDAGISQTHNLEISNGKENMRTFTSIGFTDQDGVLEASDLQRYNLRNNISGKSENGKLNYSLNTNVNYSKSNEPNSIGSGAINRNLVLGAFISVPYISPDDYTNGEDLLSPLSFANTPLFLMDRLRTYTRRESELKAIASFDLSYEVTEGLTARVQGGGDYTDVKLLRSEGPESFNALLFAQTGNNTPGFVQQFSTQSFNYNALASLTYTKEIDKHSFTVGAYTEVIRGFYDQFGFFGEGLNPKTFSPGDGAGYVDDNTANDFFVDTGSATKREAGLFSYFFSGDYDYDTRFGAGVTLRRDASYRFAETNRWGTFYSVSGRWNIHREAFMDNLNAINVLKLRASWGKTGNQRIQAIAGQFAPFIAGANFLDLYGTGAGYQGLPGLAVSQIGESDLRWEEIDQGNIGVDLEAFESRLRVNLDAYIKRTTGVYLSAPISPLTGFTNLSRNFGELENRGFDWTVAYDILREEVDGIGLTFQVVGNYNKQEVIDLPQEDGEEILDVLSGLREGGILNEYYVYRYAGVNPENGNALFLTADGETTENPDVVNDRVWLNQNIYPDVQGSFSINLDYKGLFLQTQWNYVLGVDRFDFDYSDFVDPTSIGQFRHSRDLLDAWTPDNTDGSLPSLDASNQALIPNSDFFIFDASYLRLRFISLGYNLPKSILEPAKLTSASVFVNAENLVTFTEWRGFDAESLNPSGSRLYPSPRVISFGLEVGF